jgi:hypothetical protein
MPKMIYFSPEKQEKYCSDGDHNVKLKLFRKSNKGSHLPPDMSGHYLSICKICESKASRLRFLKKEIK